MKNIFMSKELLSFIIVGNENSIQKAAEKLNLSSPPVCKRIKKLEFQLGIKLFQRKNKRMELTEEGYTLYKKATSIHQDIVNLYENYKNDL